MNEKINLQDLSALLAENAAITKKEAETFLREYFEVMNEELIKDGLLKIKDLGVFKLLQVEDRESIDVTTGERVLIPAHYKVNFTPDKKLAETVNEPFSFFETVEIDDSTVEELHLLPEENASEDEEYFLQKGEEETVIEEEPIIEQKEEEPVIPAIKEESIIEQEEEPSIEEKEEETVIPAIEEEPIIGQEEEPVIEKGPHFEWENNIIDDTGQESVYGQEQIYIPAPKDFCVNCRYDKGYHTYREKYIKCKEKYRKTGIIITALSVLLIAALGFIAYLLFFEGRIPFKYQHPAAVIAPIDTATKAIKTAPDTVSEVSAPPADSMPPEVKPEKIEAPKTAHVAAVGGKQIIITAGERLTTISQRVYGDKVFWIYIYIENRARISNPDVLPVGLEITIPPASKYGIDSNNPASIEKAKNMAVRYS
jgi:nucleoid DNA-binding protein